MKTRTYSICRMTACCMRPVVCEGDFLLVEKSDPARLHTGDLLLLPSSHPGASNYVHRLIGVLRKDEQTYILTKGDACRNMDPPILDREVLGHVVLVGREGGRWVSLDTRKMRILGWVVARFHRLLWAAIPSFSPIGSFLYTRSFFWRPLWGRLVRRILLRVFCRYKTAPLRSMCCRAVSLFLERCFHAGA